MILKPINAMYSLHPKINNFLEILNLKKLFIWDGGSIDEKFHLHAIERTYRIVNRIFLIQEVLEF